MPYNPLIASLGYSFATLASGLLAVLALTLWRERPHHRWLAAASFLSFLWAGAATLHPTFPYVLGALEVVRDAGWIAYLARLLDARRAGAPRPGFLRLLVSLPVVLAALLLAGLLFWGYSSTPAPGGGLPFFAGMMGLTLIGLVLVEQVYRSTRKEDRWALKFLAVGLGALFTYDFYLYTKAMLLGGLDWGLWSARGYANALLMPLLAISLARQSDAQMRISRHLVFHTATLLGAGTYLLLMAAVGYYIRLFGGDWGGVLQTLFLFATLLLLMVVVFSGTLRARLRVLLSKHLFSYHYDYREEWLRFTRALSQGAPGGVLCERAVEALAGLVESPGGALWLREEGGLVRAGHWNMSDAPELPGDADAFVAWLEQKQWVIDADEYRREPARYEGLALPAGLHAAADLWLIIPLLVQEQAIGVVALKRSLAHVRLNWEVGDLIKTAARQAATHLAQMKAANDLIVARQFESYNRATTFVIHDLKNLVAQLSLLLSNAKKHRDNPEFQQDMLLTVESSISRMNKILAQLRRSAGSSGRAAIELDALLPDIAASKGGFRLKPELRVACTPCAVLADAAQLARAIGHVLQNALEATPEDGRVIMALNETGGMARLEISDTGTGMDAEFIRTRLFRPFDSTKGAGMGIGAYECREYVRELGGRVEVESAPGQGTRFRILLPLARRNNDLGVAA